MALCCNCIYECGCISGSERGGGPWYACSCVSGDGAEICGHAALLRAFLVMRIVHYLTQHFTAK
eukprot:6021644-Karenia_brevis.AAC.1